MCESRRVSVSVSMWEQCSAISLKGPLVVFLPVDFPCFSLFLLLSLVYLNWLRAIQEYQSSTSARFFPSAYVQTYVGKPLIGVVYGFSFFFFLSKCALAWITPQGIAWSFEEALPVMNYCLAVLFNPTIAMTAVSTVTAVILRSLHVVAADRNNTHCPYTHAAAQ